jgi:hypothetical protein
MLDGASRRFARKPPDPDPDSMKRFGEFVDNWLKENMTPLPADADVSFETWINNAPYPLWRKEEMRRVYEESLGELTSDNVIKFDKHGRQLPNKHFRLNSFQKDETYPTYKAARAINSRSDEFKVRVGPIFKAIERELFALPYFIKHTPVDERANEILRELYQEGAKIFGSDYTSFEALFTKLLMETVEFKLYKYMTKFLPDQEWYKIVTTALSGKNACHFRNKFTITVEATRMSGEMCTSLGNSFTNLMAMLFVGKELGWKNLRLRVEGDDSINTFYGKSPTPEDFSKIGLIIKIEEYDSLTEGSFCGIIADADEMINVTDPINAMLDFGWTTRSYAHSGIKRKKQLLKAKALSLAYQYPGCPILSKLAEYGLRVTSDVAYSLGDMCEYEREQFKQLNEKYRLKIPKKETGIKTRLLVEKRYNLSVEDQLNIEAYLDSKQDLSPIVSEAVLSNCHPDAADYYTKYVYDFRACDESIDCPIDGNLSPKKQELIILEKYEPEKTTKGGTASKPTQRKWRKKEGACCDQGGHHTATPRPTTA